jgi:hypothetical protein
MTRLVADAFADVAKEIMDWAASTANSGPYSEEAYRTCIHVTNALVMVAGKLDAAIAQPVSRDDLDHTLAADVAAGMSLRKCADKHGVKVGRVRGAVNRANRAVDPDSAGAQ